MKLKIDFNLLLGADIPGVPEPEIKPEFAASPGAEHAAPPAGAPKEVMKIPQSIEITDEGGKLTGWYTHPIWGRTEARDVCLSPAGNCLSFAGRSGNDDKGGADSYFDIVISMSPATDCVVGFSAGQPPFFRSFLPIEGRITEKE
jgi:hypothetical protein